MEWIKVTDRLPSKYGRYLICRLGAKKIHFETWNNTNWAYNSSDITHWMPLPDLPKE